MNTLNYYVGYLTPGNDKVTLDAHYQSVTLGTRLIMSTYIKFNM
ncbi:hypothetical protein L3i20_v202860 [Paenibacillus sp. L3-i20]|nr:hypothetical protein L3i20_v202860 [Paenibacillus sp. L3-i20]